MRTTGRQTPIVGAHSVGVEDGGPGLPVLGWSTQGGDLRIAHFVGMHALQVLPLIGWWIARRRLGRRHQVALLAIAAGAYSTLTLLLAWQALRGQPLLGPAARTLGAALALVAITGLSTTGVATLGPFKCRCLTTALGWLVRRLQSPLLPAHHSRSPGWRRPWRRPVWERWRWAR